MTRFLLGLLTGLVLAVVAGFIFVVAMARFGEAKPSVPDGATVVVTLDGEVPEKPPMHIPLPFYESQAATTVQEMWSIFDRARSDSKVKAMLLVLERVDAGWGKLSELRDGILKFRKSGKPVFAMLNSSNSRDYYLASAADRVSMSREDALDLKGLRAEALFFKNTLDKLGIQAEIEHAGKYKDAGDMLTRNSMSPESREVLNSLLDGIYGGLIHSIAEGRKKSPEEIRSIIDLGPFTAEKAKANGLVDALYYEDEIANELKSRIGQQELKKITHRDYVRALRPEGRKRIALVVGEGTILQGDGDEEIQSDTFVRLLRRVGADRTVDGVILRVDSPGGDGIASDEILREVKLLAQKKPLVVSMSDLAASGGYYIAATGDPIVAYPHTLTGSIGVIFGKLNLRGLYTKLGVQKDIITRGRFAAIDSDYQPLDEAGRKKLRELLDDMYVAFVSRVAESRKRKYEEIEPLAQGRVWLGSQAKQNGLVDHVGGLDRAIELAKGRAKIAREEKVRLIPYPGRRSLLDHLLSRSAESWAHTKIEAALEGFEAKLWLKGGIMKYPPYRVVVK
jgi:protease-4